MLLQPPNFTTTYTLCPIHVLFLSGQAMLTERIDGKLNSSLKRRGYALRVDSDVNGIGFRHLKQPLDGFLRQRDGQYAILERIARKNVGKARRNDGLDRKSTRLNSSH